MGAQQLEGGCQGQAAVKFVWRAGRGGLAWLQAAIAGGGLCDWAAGERVLSGGGCSGQKCSSKAQMRMRRGHLRRGRRGCRGAGGTGAKLMW